MNIYSSFAKHLKNQHDVEADDSKTVSVVLDECGFRIFGVTPEWLEKKEARRKRKFKVAASRVCSWIVRRDENVVDWTKYKGQ